MEVQRDFRDLFELLNAHKVEYMIRRKDLADLEALGEE